MRIITAGKLPDEEKIKTCAKCNTVFAYTPRDTKHDYGEWDYINCPVCNTRISTPTDSQVTEAYYKK